MNLLAGADPFVAYGLARSWQSRRLDQTNPRLRNTNRVVDLLRLE